MLGQQLNKVYTALSKTEPFTAQQQSLNDILISKIQIFKTYVKNTHYDIFSVRLGLH